MPKPDEPQTLIRICVTVPMDREMERVVKVLSARQRISKAEWIRLAIRDAIGRHAEADTKTETKG